MFRYVEVDEALSIALGLDPDNRASELISDPFLKFVTPVFRDRNPSAWNSNCGIIKGLSERSFRVLLKDIPVYEAQVRVDGLLVMENAERVRRCGVDVERVVHPLTGGEGICRL